MIRSNDDYLTASYLSVGEEVKELVRVQRHAGSFVRILPASRLGTYKRVDNVEAIMSLNPGDVFLLDGMSVEQKDAKSQTLALTLLAATPVYDELTGDVFGMVLIETDLERDLEDLLEATNAAASVYVTNVTGEIVMHHSRERGIELGRLGNPVAGVVPQLEGFFSSSQIAETQTDESSYYATRVRLGTGQNSTILGIVLTLDK